MPRAFTDAERHRIRGALVNAARRAVAGAGLRRTPVAQLCRDAGISKGAFYHFFDSKEALAVEMLMLAEARSRSALLDAVVGGEGALVRVVDVLFDQTWDDPALGILADPEEMAWLTRGLPAGDLEQARGDDDAFFSDLYDALAQAGEVPEGTHGEAFCGLPVMAMALEQQRDLLGDRMKAVRDLIKAGIVLALQRP